jgi:hypothetical protein
MGLQFQWEQAIRVCSQGLEALVQSKVQGGLYVHRFVCDFVGGVARWIPGLPHIQCADPHSVAVRGDFVNCASISA